MGSEEDNITRKSWLRKLKGCARKQRPDFERERSRGERNRQKQRGGEIKRDGEVGAAEKDGGRDGRRWKVCDRLREKSIRERERVTLLVKPNQL